MRSIFPPEISVLRMEKIVLFYVVPGIREKYLRQEESANTNEKVCGFLHNFIVRILAKIYKFWKFLSDILNNITESHKI